MKYLIVALCILFGTSNVFASDNAKMFPVLVEAVKDLTHMDVDPKFEEMNTDAMKADMCVHPENSSCPTLVSVHPPMTDRIIVNSDIDVLHDLNAQAQIVHVIVIYMLEKGGKYSPDMPCSLAFKLDAWADNVQGAFLDTMAQQYANAGKPVPTIARPQVVTFCTPDGHVKEEDY